MTDIYCFSKIAGMAASIIMPLFNIPLVLKIWRRKSSADISIVWALGIWISIIVMLPAALLSEDLVFRIFGIINFVMFSVVVFFVLRYR